LKPISYRYLVLLVSPFLFAPSWANETVNLASNQANPLNNSNPFARASAMGSAFVGVADDASALLTNPAGLALVNHGEIAFNSDLWLVNTFQETALAGIGLLPGMGLGLAAHYLDYGTFEGRDELGSLAGTYTASRWSGTAGLGFSVLKNLSLGIGFQLVESNLAGTTSSAWIGQMGLLWNTDSGLRLGAACGGLGFASSTGSIESDLEFGLSYPIRFSTLSRLSVAAGGACEAGSTNYLNVGVEYGFDQKLFLRTGYQQPLQDNSITGFTGLTAGFGFILNDVSFDYAYLPYGDLGESHRISVGYNLGPAAVTPSPIPVPTSTPTPPPSPTPQPLKADATPSSNSLTVLFDIPSNAVAAGQKLEEEGKYKQASELYRQALRDNPKDASAWEALGELYERAGQREYAAQCFEKAILLKPGNQKLIDWLANYHAGKP